MCTLTPVCIPLCYATCGPDRHNMEPKGDICRLKSCKGDFENDVLKGIQYIFAFITTNFPNENKNWLLGFISFLLPGKSLLLVFNTHTTMMYSVSSGLQLNGYWYYLYMCTHLFSIAHRSLYILIWFLFHHQIVCYNRGIKQIRMNRIFTCINTLYAYVFC